MPDWTYHPIFRPLLFALPAEVARDLTLGGIGRLAALPLGPQLIELLGDMSPPPGVGREVAGVHFPSPVGLGAGLDPHLLGQRALARFGVGFLEVGPVTRAPLVAPEPVRRLDALRAIRYPDAPVNDGVEAVVAALRALAPAPVPIAVRLAHRPGAEPGEAAEERAGLIAQLAPRAHLVVLETRWGADERWTTAEWAAHLDTVVGALRRAEPGLPLFVGVAPDLPSRRVESLVDAAIERGVRGLVVTESVRSPEGGLLIGAPVRDAAVRQVRWLADRWGDRLAIIGSGGVHDPADALDLLDNGADLVQVHSGLVFTGPGLAKRINEALAASAPVAAAAKTPPGRLWPGWVWFALLGLGLAIGAVLAAAVAATRVVLPYDERFVGLSRAELAAVNPNLLAFLAHDRLTLAGTMWALGVLYLQLALHGMRRGARWAREAVRVSGVVGFASFFLFLGFGYFDPLHALVTLALAPLFLLGFRGRLPSPRPAAAGLRSDRRWLLGLWGQLLVIVVGVGLMAAGGLIAGIGVSQVFVPQDLAFMGTTREALQAASPRLVPLIAHDRAGFGGALASDGLLVVLVALWGYRQGARWLWWTWVVAGLPAYVAALGVHFAVGYADAWHLLPGFLALALYLAGLACSYPYLTAHPASNTRTARMGETVAA